MIYGKVNGKWYVLLQKATMSARKRKVIPLGYIMVQSLSTGNPSIIKSVDLKSRTTSFPKSRLKYMR